jgi:hypothetical protein
LQRRRRRRRRRLGHHVQGRNGAADPAKEEALEGAKSMMFTDVRVLVAATLVDFFYPDEMRCEEIRKMLP